MTDHMPSPSPNLELAIHRLDLLLPHDLLDQLVLIPAQLLSDLLPSHAFLHSRSTKLLARQSKHSLELVHLAGTLRRKRRRRMSGGGGELGRGDSRHGSVDGVRSGWGRWRREVDVKYSFVGERRGVLGLRREVESFGEEESAEAGFDDLWMRFDQLESETLGES